MRARIRDTEIFFDIDGAGLVADDTCMQERPVAFIVHGGPGSDHTGLKARYAPLTRQMQLVYFDQRGQGRSARGDAMRYTLDENVEDLEALRNYLGCGPIVSIGTSYGGMVAMAHAVRYPDAVSHLVLVVTASHAGYAARARQIVAERGTHEQVQQCDALFNGLINTPEEMLRYYSVMGSLYARRYDPAQLSQGLNRTIFAPEALNRAHGPEGFLRSFDLRPQLAAITSPTLIIGARHDWICAPEFSVELHRLIPDSDLRIFEESGHFVTSDEPQRLLDAIAGFIVYRQWGRRA